ncbi:sensor histidine kinase [Butyrivibrio sp. CB08]|uniref:sensor histidine kinase n=1 Tax=Butyrivibrio sp. CB08 TaxID=2364879 RepID=UPI000EA9CAE2|nr:HAMP domain-containing sensor histidine kinase [Butyrivibrio sp. CB08]RKM59410.1 sensor histidine kinase [Butyrivibrio sp. CB08]
MRNQAFRRIMIIGSAVTILMAFSGFIFAGITAGILPFITGAMLLAVFFYYTKKRYSRIEELNDYLVKVLSGSDTPDILNQEEGELSILVNNIYKASSTLKAQNEILSDDKKQLASAIADISHQLKTPLTSMMVMNDLLAVEDDPEKRREFLQTQSAQLSRMNWLIQTLLKLSKLDAGTIELKREQLSAKELMAEVIKPFEIQFELRGVSYKQDIKDMSIVCDKNWTVEALQNIVKNCIEHMDAGGELEITTLDTTLFGQITIKDTGCGIAAEDIPHIFERFYKGKNAGKDSVGIGLALTKAIIEDQHGEIIVKSEEGVGSAFVIKLYKTIV